MQAGPDWPLLPPRVEWDTTDNPVNPYGYCGEVSFQTVALYYGVWVSQQEVRNLNTGGNTTAIILGDGHSEAVLGALKLHYDVWDFNNQANPQFQNFMVWAKSYLVRNLFPIFAVYVSDHSSFDPDYDHILPAFGIRTSDAAQTTFDPGDVVYYNNNVGDDHTQQTGMVWRDFGTLVQTPNDPMSTTDPIQCGDSSKPVIEQGFPWSGSPNGGCVPQQVDYGVSVTGIVDDNSATVPARLLVTNKDGSFNSTEPDPNNGGKPVELRGHATCGAFDAPLVPGKSYTLLRYNSLAKVPTSGNAQFFAGASDVQHAFTATANEYTWDDPTAFLNTAVVVYRCVPN